ncbi:MAG: hypothetical protein CME36_10015 [unclassified Hahellaceae]|nr:hypothetical protein [Hahellaceae bacterium]
MFLTLSRAFIALTLSALFVFLVGTPLLVRYYSGPFIDAYLAPLALERLGGEPSFNPLKLQLTVEQLELGLRPAETASKQAPIQAGQVERLTIDFFERSLTLERGWLAVDSAATVLGIEHTERGLDAEGWLQPLNALFLSPSDADWPSTLELPRTIFQATVHNVKLEDFEARLGDTGSVFRISELTGSILTGGNTAERGGAGMAAATPLHNWDIDARINDRPFQLSVRPQVTADGAIFYLELKDLQFEATAFSSAGLVLPPLPGLETLALMEGQLAMQGELVVEFEAEKRALTAIDLQLGFSGLRGQGAYTDATGAERTLNFRAEQFAADVDQLQWLSDDARWTPERIRLQTSSELVLTSLRFNSTPPTAESFISTKAATAQLLLDWQRQTLFEIHSDQFSIQGLKARLDSQALGLAEGALTLCGLTDDLATAHEQVSINTSMELSALTAYQDNCWFRQLILEGGELTIESDKPVPSIDALRIHKHRLVVTDFSTVNSAEPTSVEFSGLLPNPSSDSRAPVNLVLNLLSNTPELIRFSMNDYRPQQLDLIGSWMERLTGLPLSVRGAEAHSDEAAGKSMFLEVGRLGDQYAGFAQLRKSNSDTVEQTRALSFTVSPSGGLPSDLWTPLIRAVIEMNSKASSSVN